MALTLWLTDRSRVEAGLQHCGRERYLSYHAGPHGYGWALKAQSIPLVTGTLVHAPIAAVLQEVQRTDAIPSDAFIYAQIQAATATYDTLIETRGLRHIVEPADLEKRRREQLTLLEGLVWTWARVALPSFHQQYQVVSVEVEDVTVLGCTCGLGDGLGDAETHDARGCAGIGWMTRADAIAQSRVSGEYAYHEIKTTGDAGANWEAQWAYRRQLQAGVLGAESRLSIRIDAVYIHALLKGMYRSEYSQETKSYTGPKYQQSPLVYGYRRPANPPLTEEDWALKFAYVDELGKSRRLTKDYERTGIWDLPTAWWDQGGCLSPSDYWTRWIGATLGECYRLIGPIHRADWKLEGFQRQLVAEERRWQGRLQHLYDHSVAWGTVWGDPAFEAELDTEIPQAAGGACQSFFGDTCPMVPLCEHHPGWETPELMGYVPRRPHHTPELEQAIARGLLPPDEGASEGVDA